MTDIKNRVNRINQVLTDRKTRLTVQYQEILKNNGYKPALLVKHEKDRLHMAMVLYLDDEMREKSCEELAGIIYQTYMKSKPKQVIGTDELSRIWKKEFVREHVEPRLVGVKDNDYVKDKIRIPFLDMAVVFFIEVIPQTGIIVNQDNFKEIDMTAEELFACAKENIQGRETVDCLADVIGIDVGNENVPFGVPEMYILSNTEKLYGAQMMLNETALKSVFMEIGEYYIIPSSVHELILVPTVYASASDLLQMNKEVNATEIEPEDRLTTAVYKYSDTGLEKVL